MCYISLYTTDLRIHHFFLVYFSSFVREKLLFYYFIIYLFSLKKQVHKIVDLSAFPDREAMWYLEVMEAYKLFYEPLIEEFM